MDSYHHKLIKLILLTLLNSFQLHASLGDIEKILFAVKKKSPEMQISHLNKTSSLELNRKESLIFDSTGFFSANYLNEDSPKKSPFSTSETDNYEYELGIKKIWSSGFDTKINYGLSDVSSSFYSGSKTSYLLPKLEFSISSKIFQDFFYDRYKYLLNEIKQNEKAIALGNKVRQKEILTKALIDFSLYLELKEDLFFQSRLCNKTKVQTSKLNKKRKRGSVSNKDYYLSLRESTLCELKIESLQKKKYIYLEKFNSNFNLSLKNFKEIKITNIFKELEEYYLNSRKSDKVNLEENDEIKYSKYKLETARNQNKKYQALTHSNLELELKTGATGLDSSLSDSNDDIVNFKYPYVYVGVNIDLPWKGKSAIALANSSMYQTKAREIESKYIREKVIERYSTLKTTLKNDFEIYQKYVTTAQLSKNILNEAQKDFTNGKIDFYSLTEFNKSLIQDQKNLSTYRIQLIVRMIEYLDYHNYFNKYLGEL